MTVVSCETHETGTGRARHMQTTCHGHGTDGPSGVTAGQWRLPVPDYIDPGSVLTVRCKPDGACYTGLGSWTRAGLFATGLGLAILGNVLFRGAHALVHRYAPTREGFFRRRSTAIGLITFNVLAALLVVGSFTVSRLLA